MVDTAASVAVDKAAMVAVDETAAVDTGMVLAANKVAVDGTLDKVTAVCKAEVDNLCRWTRPRLRLVDEATADKWWAAPLHW